MFAYCNNNPIVYIDVQGFIPSTLIDIVPTHYGQAEISESDNPKDSPPDHPDFEPPKKGNQKKRNPNGNGWGWVDNKGNVWVWTPNMHGGRGWTVQEPNGGHSHAYPGGGRRTHFTGIAEQGILTSFPSIQQNLEESFLPLLPATVAFGFIMYVACDAITEEYCGQ